jgi:hypothetical protein
LVICDLFGWWSAVPLPLESLPRLQITNYELPEHKSLYVTHETNSGRGEEPAAPPGDGAFHLKSTDGTYAFT